MLLAGGSKKNQTSDIADAVRLLERLPTEKAMTRKTKMVPSRSHEEATIESFRKDPFFAADYLNAVLEDGDQEELMVALRRMSEAFGGFKKLASKSKLNPNTLYRTLSPKMKSRTQKPACLVGSHGNAAYRSPAVA